MKTKHYVTAEAFQSGGREVYSGEYGWAVNKRGKKMAHVIYRAVHENAAFAADDVRRGAGRDYAKWIFSEEPGSAEHIFRGGFELMIDAHLEPGATIGLHWHYCTEEIYYLLEGSLRMTTVATDGSEHTEKLKSGDAHAVRLGQGHYGKAGKKGARYIAVTFLA